MPLIHEAKLAGLVNGIPSRLADGDMLVVPADAMSGQWADWLILFEQ